jgi:hypothetical protein
MKNHSAACELADKALQEALDKIDELEEDDFRDAKSIIELLKENLTLWREEEQDDNNIDDLCWDNAKKLIEASNQKGTLAHHAAITGDTVGDPFKDTAGPSLHVIITTMSTTALVLGPLFVGK